MSDSDRIGPESEKTRPSGGVEGLLEEFEPLLNRFGSKDQREDVLLRVTLEEIKQHIGKQIAGHLLAPDMENPRADLKAIRAAGRPRRRVPNVVPIQGDPLGRGLFYSGKVNSLFGDAGSRKSKTMYATWREHILRGEHVVHFEFDGNNAEDLFWDAVDHDVPEELAEERLHIFVSPRSLPKLTSDEEGARLVTLDAVNPAMVALGLEMNTSGVGVDTLVQTFMQPFTNKGAAGVLLDHPGHGDKDRPSNSIRKSQAIRGTMLRIQNELSSMSGTRGYSSVKLLKDNNGRGFKVGDTVGYIVTDGTHGDGKTRVSVVSKPDVALLASATQEGDRPKKPTGDAVREQVKAIVLDAAMPLDLKTIHSLLPEEGRPSDKTVQRHLADLVKAGYLDEIKRTGKRTTWSAATDVTQGQGLDTVRDRAPGCDPDTSETPRDT